MRINLRYGAAIGTLAAAAGILGPMAAQAGQAPGTSIPVPTRAQAISVQAPATHLLAITGKSVVLSSIFERPAWQHDNGTAQREGNTVANAQQRIGLPGQQNRVLGQNYRCYCGYCGWSNGGYNQGGSYSQGGSSSQGGGYNQGGSYNNSYYRYHCCPYGIRDHDHRWGWGQCCGYPYYPYGHSGGSDQGGSYSQGGGYNNSYYYGCCRSWDHRWGYGRGTGYSCYPTPYGGQHGRMQGQSVEPQLVHH